MKKIFFLCLCALVAAPAMAADEKIDPDTYICAELIASTVTGEPPMYEALQLEGYAAAKAGSSVADPDILLPILTVVSDSCSAKPAEKALAHWQTARKDFLPADDGAWRADKTTCADYSANPEDGSGFVIWLDAYNRGKTGKKTSIFKDQATLDNFLDVCAKNPQKLMIDVLNANAR